MSVPATGRLALFRNPLPEVERFFELKHKNHYRIYNCCPEHPYPDFQSNCEIVKYNVQDHSPPTLSVFIHFLNDATTFMNESTESTIAVHCRGGKGRSGVLCCAWLMHAKEAKSADAAMALFAMSRTEWRGGASGKLQGVETPSQKRYVYQLEQLMKKQKAYLGTPGNPPLVMPAVKALKLKSLVLENLFRDPSNVAKGGALVCVVKVNTEKGWEVVHTSQPILHELLTSRPVFGLDNFEVKGDVCIGVYQSEKMKGGDGSKKVVKSGKEKGVLFMFFFHTTFTSNNEMQIGCKMLDKAVKNKAIDGAKKPYNTQEGGVRLVFE
jgi:protein-tyrosine phosphatase